MSTISPPSPMAGVLSNRANYRAPTASTAPSTSSYLFYNPSQPSPYIPMQHHLSHPHNLPPQHPIQPNTEAHPFPMVHEPAPPTHKIQDVAYSFVFQYYTKLHKDGTNLHLFYNVDSHSMRFNESVSNLPRTWKATGQEEICEYFKLYLPKNPTSRILVIEQQESVYGSILIFIYGFLRTGEDCERDFVQSILLAKQENNHDSWYIKNEIFYFIDHHYNDDLTESNSQAPVPIESTSNVDETLPEEEKDHWTQTVASDTIQYETTVAEKTLAEKEPQEELSYVDNSTEPTLVEEPGTFKLDTNVEVKSNSQKDEMSHIPAVPPTNSVRQWGETEAPQSAPTNSSDWPLLGETLDTKTTEDSQTHSVVPPLAQQYDQSTFAYHLMANVNPNKKGALPKAKVKTVKEVTTTNNQNAQEANNLSGGGTGKPEVPKTVDAMAKKIRLIDPPSDITEEEIRRSIMNRLKNYNDGHVIEIIGEVIELDRQQSAEYLLSNGWYLSGKEIKIAPAGKPQNPRSNPNRRKLRPHNANSSGYKGPAREGNRNFNPNNKFYKNNDSAENISDKPQGAHNQKSQTDYDGSGYFGEGAQRGRYSKEKGHFNKFYKEGEFTKPFPNSRNNNNQGFKSGYKQTPKPNNV